MKSLIFDPPVRAEAVLCFVATMRTFNDLYAIIDLLGAVPGMFLAGFVWRKKGPSRFLSAGLVAYSFLLGSMAMTRLGLMELSRQWNFYITALVHVAWPLFYLYVRAVTRGEPTAQKRQLAHAAPLVLYLGSAVLPSIFATSVFSVFYGYGMAMTAVIATGYSVAMLVELAKYKKKLTSFFSEASRLQFTWMTVNITLWLFVVVAQVLLFAIQSTGWQRPEIFEVVHGMLINVITASWVYVIGYYALSNPQVLELSIQMNRELETLEKDSSSVSEPEPEQAPTTERSAEVLQKLALVMASQRPYLDELLTLSSLAKTCGIPAYLLGRVINKELGKNFMTYINEHRVARAQELLKDPQRSGERILDIAFSCGFRTKSAFNDSFKKLTGMTPSEFRRQNGV